MNEGPRVTAVNALPQILSQPAPDDAGAETASRYDWQSAMAVIDGLASIAACWDSSTKSPSTDISIVCEHHEDYVICRGQTIELVSVKHRETSLGPWTLALLADKGGIAHLFVRWRAFRMAARLTLVTNGGIKSGETRDLVNLADRLSSSPLNPLTEKESGLLTSFAKRLHLALKSDQTEPSWMNEKEPTDTFENLVLQFLRALKISHSMTGRSDIHHVAPTKYAAPFLKIVGLQIGVAAAFWQQAMKMVHARMSAQGPTTAEGLAETIMRINSTGVDEADLARLEARTFTASDLIQIAEVCIEAGMTFVEDSRSIAPTRLALKLHNSGCGETTILAAERAALHWRRHESAAIDGAFGSSSEVERLKLWVHLRSSSIAEQIASSAPDPHSYGPAMWSELSRTFSLEPMPGGPLGADELLFLGAACNLASECQIWFSDKFDMTRARVAFPLRLNEVTG